MTNPIRFIRSLAAYSRVMRIPLLLVLPAVLLFLVLSAFQTASAQQPAPAASANDAPAKSDAARTLTPGAVIERTLAGGRSHSYWLTLAAGQFGRFVAEQKGIDLALMLYNRYGEELIGLD